VDRSSEIGLGLGNGRLIRPRVNDEQNVAGIHPLPVAKADFGDAAHDLRANFGIVDRVDAAREFRKWIDSLGCQLVDCNRYRRIDSAGVAARLRVPGGISGDREANTRNRHGTDEANGCPATKAF
jgi:hypothetical protein